VEDNPRLRGLKLDAWFIKPIQRLCKYPLLLVELKKSTNELSEEHSELAKVVEKLNRAISKINEIRRDSERKQRCREIERSGVSGLPSGFEFGELLREEKLSGMIGSSRKNLIVWLFATGIVLAKKNKVKISDLYRCVYHIPFTPTLKFTDLMDDDEKGLVNALEFQVVTGGEGEKIVLNFTTPDMKAEWYQVIRPSLSVKKGSEAGFVAPAVTITRNRSSGSVSGRLSEGGGSTEGGNQLKMVVPKTLRKTSIGEYGESMNVVENPLRKTSVGETDLVVQFPSTGLNRTFKKEHRRSKSEMNHFINLKK
jgi:hypothetical protein